MTALVTGSAGFIGSNLVDRLIELGHKVIGVDNLATGKKRNVNPISDFRVIDIRSLPFIDDHQLKSVDTIFHLAALSRIRPSMDKAFESYDVNSTGTLRVLELAQRLKAKVIYAGSSTAYHDLDASPYAYSKWLGEKHCEFYSRAYGLSTAIARFFLVYGPRQIGEGEYANVIGIFERQRRAGEALTVTGTGEQRRDFIHVRDVVDGLVAMSEGEWRGEVFNLGTGRNHSINEIVAMFGGPTKYIERPQREAEATLADLSFVREKLPGWTPKMRIEDYIKEVVNLPLGGQGDASGQREATPLS